MSIGARLYNLRVDRNISKEELGERLNVSKNTIYRWEMNHFSPRRGTLVRLAELYGVSVDWIITGIDSEDNELEKRLSTSTSIMSDKLPSKGLAYFKHHSTDTEKYLVVLFGMLSQTRQGRLIGYLDALYNEEVYQGMTLKP